MVTSFKLYTSKISEEDQQTVNARELHEFLGIKKAFSNWIKYQIDRFNFIEGLDFVKTQDVAMPNLAYATGSSFERIEYFISLSMAKELAMVSNTEKGKEARLYFLECERRVKKQSSVPMLPDYPAALRQLASQIEKNGILENQIKESAPKVELADNFLKSDGDFYIRVVAKAIGIGVEKLFDWLRAHKIITKFNEPYAEFSKRGILRPRAATFTRSDGTSQTRLTTKITTNGIYYIRDRLIKEGLLPQNTQIDFDFLAQESKK